MRWAWRLVALLSLPAVALHELTHAAVAWPWADVTIEWRGDVPWYLEPALRVRMENWNINAPTWAMLGAYLAPLLLGYVAAGIAVWVFLSDVSFTISPMLAGFVGVNWLWYTAASVGDLDPVLNSVKAARGR